MLKKKKAHTGNTIKMTNFQLAVTEVSINGFIARRSEFLLMTVFLSKCLFCIPLTVFADTTLSELFMV